MVVLQKKEYSTFFTMDSKHINHQIDAVKIAIRLKFINNEIIPNIQFET